jgi:hypothetical protein
MRYEPRWNVIRSLRMGSRGPRFSLRRAPYYNMSCQTLLTLVHEHPFSHENRPPGFFCARLNFAAALRSDAPDLQTVEKTPEVLHVSARVNTEA